MLPGHRELGGSARPGGLTRGTERVGAGGNLCTTPALGVGGGASSTGEERSNEGFHLQNVVFKILIFIDMVTARA